MADSAVVRAYGRTTDRLMFGAVDAVSSLWLRLPQYRDANVDRFLGAAVPLIEGAHSRMATLTAAYMVEVSQAGGFSAERALLDAGVIASPRGVPNREVLGRPAVTLYTALSRGKTMTQGVSESDARLRSIVATDLQLVRTLQSQWSMASTSARFYRRVLGAGESCDLCVIASRNKYSRAELMPIHDNCRCRVEPVPDNWRRPRITSNDLDADRFSESVLDDIDDLDSLIAVEQNGEIGPVLVAAGQKFTGASDF